MTHKRVVWEKEQHPSEEERMVQAFTRRERPHQRKRRIAVKRIDPFHAEAIRRMLMAWGV